MLELAGVALIAWGIWQYSRPAALIWVGAACFGGSYAIEHRRLGAKKTAAGGRS